jgi:hypothetical protein
LPERPRRLPAIRGFFFNPSLEGGLELFELSCPQLSTKISDFSLEHRDLALQRSDQLLDFGGKMHPTLDSDSQPQVSQVPLSLSAKENSPKQWYFGLTPLSELPWEMGSWQTC